MWPGRTALHIIAACHHGCMLIAFAVTLPSPADSKATQAIAGHCSNVQASQWACQGIQQGFSHPSMQRWLLPPMLRRDRMHLTLQSNNRGAQPHALPRMAWLDSVEVRGRQSVL